MSDSDVQRELGNIEHRPVSDDERKTACRAIMRFKGRRGRSLDEDEVSPIEVTEDWVRLYVALRRASGSSTVRLNATHLRRWRARVSTSTTVKRKVFIVKKAALENLPTEPQDLQRFVIPRGDLDLPADIYGDDVLFIDDGYDRSRLNMPGLLHLEVAVKCTRESSSGGRPSGLVDDWESECEGSVRSSGSGVRRALTDDSGISVAAAPAAEHIESTQRPRLQRLSTSISGAAAPAAEHIESTSPGSEPEKAMADIIAQTVKALGLGRWVSNDASLPNTVEFWVRLFTHDITKKPREESKLTDPQKGYVKYITKMLYESECSYTNLPFIVPHFVKMQQWGSDLVPPLASVLVKLHQVELDQPDTETAFHTWLRKDFTLPQLQTVYNSVMYAGFLKKRLAAHLAKAQGDQEARKVFLPLLQESTDSAEMLAEIKIVAALDSTNVNFKDKVDLLWHTPNAWQIISRWAGLNDKWAKYMSFAQGAQWPHASGLEVQDVYAVMGQLEDAGIDDVPNLALKSLFAECLRVRKTGNAFLLRVLQEQIRARMGAIATAETSDPSEDTDLSDCKDVAKELCKSWSAAVKNVAKYPHLKSLQDVFARTPRRTLSDAGKVDPKGVPAAPAAAGADQNTAGAGMVDPNGVPAAPAAADADQNTAASKKDKTTEEADADNLEEKGPAAPAAAGASKDEEVEASAGSAEVSKDQGGKLLEKGAIVVVIAKKFKHLYNGFKGKIIRVNTKNVVVELLEGPARGDKRKFLFGCVDVVEDDAAKKAKLAEAPAEESEAPTAAAPAAEAPAEDDKPDQQCMAMFGCLDLY